MEQVAADAAATYAEQDVRLGVAGLEELAVVNSSSSKGPTGSQAARKKGRGRGRGSGTRKQACVPSRDGGAGAGAGAWAAQLPGGFRHRGRDHRGGGHGHRLRGCMSCSS
eukprot:1161301-Pelagomonas_calceolata.AAC.2